MKARAVLDGIKAQREAAASGPWEVADDPLSAGDWMVRQIDFEPDTPDDVAAAISHEPTASFIAAAPGNIERLTNALEAVLALHKPDFTDSGEGDGLGYWICSECASESDKYTDSCPTAAAIENAIQGP